MTEMSPIIPAEIVPYSDAQALMPVNDIEQRLGRRRRRAVILMAVMLAALIALATIIRIGGAVIAPGAIAVESKVKTISHPTGGVLSAVKVRDGDRVRAGDILLEFETNISGPGAQFSNQSMDQLLARQARLEAERSGRNMLQLPAGLVDRNEASTRDIVEQERRLLALRRQERGGNIALLNERIVQLRQLIQSYRVQISAAQAQVKLIGPELDGLRALYARQLVTIGRLNQLERQAVDLNGNIASLQANIAQTEARISETREQILNVDQAIRSEAGTELAQVMATISDQKIRIAEADDRFAKAVVKAPVAGIVDKLAFSTLGSVIPSGTPIAQIVPDSDILVVEASVSPADIDQLKTGQRARVMFSTLNQNVTPELSGTLTFLSAESANDGNGGPPYFRIRVTLDRSSTNSDLYSQIRAGTPAEVFLQTGDRSLLSYLFKPLLDQITRSFRQ
jgi:HlyD family type I secretion membrane fusion protein